VPFILLVSNGLRSGCCRELARALHYSCAMRDGDARLELRATCRVGGSPGQILPSEDGSLLFVADRESGRVNVVATGWMKVFQAVELEGAGIRPPEPFLLGSFGDYVFAALHGGKMAVLSSASRQLRGVVDVRGEISGMAVLRESRQAVVSASAGGEGYLGHLELGPHRLVVRRPLAGRPVPGTLVVDAAQDRGAVAIRDASGRGAIALFALRSGDVPVQVPLDADIAALALDPAGEYVYAALHGASEVAIIDVASHRVLERLPMAGHPFQLVGEPASRRVWAFCEGLGHAALIDPRLHGVVRRIFTPGASRSENRLSFDPAGRFILIPEHDGQCVSLARGGWSERSGHEDLERLEMGRTVGFAAWSPLGDEVYVGDPSRGEIQAFRVDREVPEEARRHSDSTRRRRQNPLFPP
jgi:YVTN family beta-propeller protein